ncbi:BgTH12-02008 [Blumeria graminis f. sp. triticale]|uniref:BgTH12-02008 n=1 Tax=Blumeria graminis f. sp. triticale TaxID=1689686 RepID=A0A9W4GDP3_BLUGR|nr:BgTH12-02008 [Blumeria graminis f. sp. triticale]
MRKRFGFFIAASGLYQNAVSAYPEQGGNFHLISGFICDNRIIHMGDLREEADEAYARYLRRAFIDKYPALFEDFYLFSNEAQTLLSWPILESLTSIKSGPAGKYRLIIDVNKNVLGVVTKSSPKSETDQEEFTTCEPIHLFSDKNDNISKLWIQYLDNYYKTLGFICDGEFLDEKAYLYTVNMIKKYGPGNGKKAASTPTKFSSFTDKHDPNLTLYGYPLRKLNTKGHPSGPVKTHRVIFYLQEDKEVVIKAVVSSGHDDKRCSKVWSLLPPRTTRKSSSAIIRAVKLMDNYHFKCKNMYIKASTLQLQVNFARDQVRYATFPDGINYPILQNESLRLWPLRLPESSTWSK